jgi:hypothetical protein
MVVRRLLDTLAATALIAAGVLLSQGLVFVSSPNERR